MLLFTENFGKYKQIYSDRMQISGCLRLGVNGKRDDKGAQKILGG